VVRPVFRGWHSVERPIYAFAAAHGRDLDEAMRIAVVVGTFPELSETFILDHVIGLLERGHDVQIIANRPVETEPVHYDVHSLDLVSRTVYRPSRKRPYRQMIKSVAPAVTSLLTRHPRSISRLLAHAPDPGVTHRGELKDLLAISRVSDVDLFHCHFGPICASLVGALGALKSDVPVVSTFHGYDMTAHVERHGTNCYRRLLERGDLFLPISDFFRERLLELGAPSERTYIHHMGIDLSRFHPEQRHRNSEPSLRVLTVGRMIEKKGIAYALRAVDVARRAGIAIHYTVIGDGPDRGSLEALTRELEVADQVSFLGAMDRNSVERHMRKSDVLLAPSVTSAGGDMEGIPVVIMEAMASGLPVVSSEHSGIPEIVIHEKTGLLASERDYERLGNHLVVLARDPSARRRMGLSGRSVVGQQFNVHKLNNEIIELYEALIRRRPT